jgi:hypothetical protein
LRSCNLIISSLPNNEDRGRTGVITDLATLENFYGQSQSPRVRYIRERKRLDYGKASEYEYEFELLEEQ